MNKNKLLSVIVLNGDTCSSLAKEMGITNTTFSNKINEKDGRSFTQPEIAFIKRRYHLNGEELDLIFFDSKVS